jgi:glycosyltransferase involved in cell wall biosynthesis
MYVVLTDDDKKKMKKYLNINCKRIYNPLSFISMHKSKCVNKNIICVARLLQQQKGLDLLINAFCKVSLIHKDWKLYIVGDGPDNYKINRLINRMDLKNQVIVKPFTTNIQDYYLNSSIFISSSRWEGFGLVITEAMECGLPVIAFANSGPKEIVNKQNENGILIPCGDVDKLSEAMINLIEDKDKRLQIAKASIIRAKDFNIDIITSQWREILDKEY